MNREFRTGAGDQSIQSLQYAFPYHYVPTLGRRLSLSRHWGFAASYVAALELVADRLRPVVATAPGRHRHIDIGCGDGALIYYLSRLEGFDRVSIEGVDIDDRAIAWARLFNPDARLHAGDMAALEGGFDSATLVEVIEHVPPDELAGFLRSAAGLLKPGAPLIVTVPSVEKKLAEKHYQHFTFASLRGYLQDCFDDIEVAGFERSTFLTRRLERLRRNRHCKIDAPALNRWNVNLLRRLSDRQAGHGRIFATCRNRKGTEA